MGSVPLPSSSSLLLSLHFWTSDPTGQSTTIRDTDFGAFRMHDKHELKEMHEDARRQYAQVAINNKDTFTL